MLGGLVRATGAVCLLLTCFLTRSAEAACATSGASMAWGDFWVERSGANCDCLIRSRKFSCIKTGGFRTQDASPTTVATVSGDCSTACEDLSGYSAGISTMLAKYAPGTGNYECDTAFVDGDGDGFGSCIDENDTNPRVFVKINASETRCDGVDNDSDGTIDDGFTTCPVDRKRLDPTSNMQGDGEDQVNLVEGTLIRREVDMSIDAPFGPLTLWRNYDSRRNTDDANLGQGWTHSFSVYLVELAAGDGRFYVQLPDGHQEYFWCTAGTTDRSCVIDDHRPAGNLRRISNVWYYYPGDGTRWEFGDTLYSGRRVWSQLLDSSGNIIQKATLDGSGRVQKVESANSSIYLYFTYDAGGTMDVVRISSTTINGVLDFNVIANGAVNVLDRVIYAPTLNNFVADYFTGYVYNATSKNLETVQRKINSTGLLNVASFTHDASDRVVTLNGPSQSLTVSYPSALSTQVTYNLEATGNPTTTFTHNGLWVKTRDSEQHAGGMVARTQVRDEHGRLLCQETDDSRMTKPYYGTSWVPTRMDIYGKTGDCTSGGTVERKIWSSYAYNLSRQSWRMVWNREPSFYSPASDCSGVALPSGCLERATTYVSATDDRVQKTTTKGYSRQINGSIPLDTRVMRNYYFGLDTGVCSSADSYAAKVCRVEQQNGSGTAYGATNYSYIASGATAGLTKTVKRYRSSSDASPLTTTYASHNVFGIPQSVTDEAGMQTTYTFFAYPRVQSITQQAALLASDLTTMSPVTNYGYTMLREVSRVILPKLNTLNTMYYTGATDYARPSAWATADTAGNHLEISRVLYDGMGNIKEDRVLDSINGSTPCANELCTVYDVRRERKFNVNRQMVESRLYASSQDTYDGTKSYTYVAGQLDQVTDYLGVVAAFAYDSQGRLQSDTQDKKVGAPQTINAVTSYTYDNHGRTATVTSPISVTTYTEHNDFGELVLERSRTRGEMRYNYDPAGRQSQRRWTPYKSTASIEDTCYSYDWLGRRTALDAGCGAGGAAGDWTFNYDGTNTPSGACPTQTKQGGRLSRVSGWSSNSVSLERVLCYHPDGHIYSVHQIDGAAWSNTAARGSTLIYDLNGNLTLEMVNTSPSSTANAITIERTYDAVMQDRVASVRTKVNGVWTQATSASTLPTYLALGGYKTLTYSNGITETNVRDFGDRLTKRKTTAGANTYTDINLSYDKNGNITLYDDSTGLRHLKYYAAMDALNRLRCTSRASMSACTGANPWEAAYNETFDYDASGNRTKRRGGAFTTADEDAYSYVSGPSDVIGQVTYSGTAQTWSKDYKGNLTSITDPNIPDPNSTTRQYTWDSEGRALSSNDNFLGATRHEYSPFGDRFRRGAVCNNQKSYYFYRAFGAGGASPEIALQEEFGQCYFNTINELHIPVYLEGRPVALVRAQRTIATGAISSPATYWLHSDQLGTPVLVTDNDKVERWRWENDPFGRAAPVEYTVSTNDPADWIQDEPVSASVPQSYGPLAANGNNMRFHFSAFDVKAGATRTGKDYVRITRGSDGSTVGDFTGTLGAFWSPWTAKPFGPAETTATVTYVGDAVDDGTTGIVLDKIEFTTTTNGRFLMYLRMPGQIWDSEAQASSNYQRWYRPNDGRYLSPDPIGLAGGEAGYFGYAGANPLVTTDRWGLLNDKADTYGTEGRSGAPGTSGDRPRSGGRGGRSPARRTAPLVQGPRSPDSWIDVLLLATLGYWEKRCTFDSATMALGFDTEAEESTGSALCRQIQVYGDFQFFEREVRVYDGMSCQEAFDAAARGSIAIWTFTEPNGTTHKSVGSHPDANCLNPPADFPTNFDRLDCLMRMPCYRALYDVFLSKCVERGCVDRWL